jgi:predicted TIM-barrel fold metal-dependent hydrolase
VIEKMTFIDCNCMIGRRAFREPGTIYKTEEFLRELEYHNIAGALVHHAFSVELNQAYGNRALLSECAKSTRLFPCWVVLPDHVGEMPPANQLVAEMLRQNVRAARVFPRMHGFSLDAVRSCGLSAAMEREGIVLIIPTAETDFGALGALCMAHPLLPVIVTGIAWGTDRQLFPLLERCENLHVETSSYQGHNSIEIAARRFGARRLLFGTGLPHMSPGAAKANIIYARISDDEKRMIAGGNLLRLIRQTAPEAWPNARLDEVAEIMESGRPMTPLAIDAHTHVSHAGCLGIHQCSLHAQDAEALIASMDRCGIETAMVSSWEQITSDEQGGNKLVADLIKRYPGRFIGYASFNPNYPEEIPAELERCFREYGMKGIKPYPPRHQYPLDGENNRLILEFANEHHLPILCHYGGAARTSVTAAQVEKLSEKYPNAKFIMGHAGSSWEAARACAALAKKRPRNVFAEITYTAVTFGSIEYMVKEAGEDNVLFGTDAPMRDPAAQMGWVAYAKLTVDQKQKILRGNIARILGEIRL